MEFRFIKENELNHILKQEEIDNIQSICQFSFFNDMYIIACFDYSFVGMICMKDKEIIHIYVRNNYRHKGIASQLIDKAKLLICGDIIVRNMNDYELFIKNGFINEHDDMIYQHHNEYHFANYDEVHSFIASLKQRVYALDHFKNFMNLFCNPQNQLKTIHIGGTNGKGSTVNYIKEVLMMSGYKVATFTSPALVSRLDVMKINDISIKDEEIIQYANQYMDIALNYDLSMFELEVFIAVMYFNDQNVDFAIFEVGLGGELDATNIITPMVCVNTNIGLDHVDYLGHSYQEIATTKAGIVKENIDYIVGEKKQVCLDIFQRICNEHHSSLLKVDETHLIESNLYETIFQYKDKKYTLSTPASYQVSNAALAIEVLLYLRDKKKVSFSDEILEKGIYKAKWDGRFEILRKDHCIIIDGAHNKEGMHEFCKSASKYPRIKIIFSALRDKDTHHMIESLLKVSRDLTICEFDFYRAQKAELLAEDFDVKICKDWKKAIDDAFDWDGTLFITGSLYFISQVRPYLLEKLESDK
jgi:dihydrofolate synthase/folylpolyglutamate synthase